MDQHDKEFETFLRQFRLRQPGALPGNALLKPRSTSRWVIAAAAALILVAALSILLVRKSTVVALPYATVVDAGSPSLYKVGEKIDSGRLIRSNSAVGLLLGLNDGSRLEVRSQSELQLESASDGVLVRLNVGSILVTAEKQGAGHLYVETRDATVSVVGTVFLVHAEQSGTRVVVVEGEVHVRQGTEVKNLLPGEQTATNAALPLTSVAEEISWSRRATEFAAMLPQTSTPAVNDREPLVPPTTNTAPGDLPFHVEANYFRLTNDSTRTQITVQITTKATIHITGEVYRSDNRGVPQSGFSHDIQAEADLPSVFQVSTYLTPGKYKLHLTLTDKNSQNIQTDDVLLSVPRISDQTLQASSMVLSYNGTDWTNVVEMGISSLGKKMMTNPSGVFRTDEGLNILQEFYGLRSDPATQKPDFNVELLILQNKKEIKRQIEGALISSGAGGKQLSYSSTVSLAQFAPGAYEVQTKVMDNLTRQSLVTTRKFTVVAVASSQAPAPGAPETHPPVQLNLSDVLSISAGKSVFDRVCTTCHSGNVARQMGPLGGLFSYADRVALTEKKGEKDQLLAKGMTRQYPKVLEIQKEIDQLEAKAAAARKKYEGYVSGHRQQFGAVLSDRDMPALVDYLFDLLSSKPVDSIPSDIPLQRQ